MIHPTIPYIWKVADFGITTTGTSRRLIATKDARGTAHYCAPEILLSDPDVPCYTNKVDIWGVGLILFKLVTAERAFRSANAVMRYFWKEEPSPSVSMHPWTVHAPEPGDDFLSNAVRDLRADHPISNSVIWRRKSGDYRELQSDIDTQVSWLLNREHDRRPSIEDVTLHFAAISVINDSFIVWLFLNRFRTSPSPDNAIGDIISLRHQFLIRLEVHPLPLS
jgi:serine/threonine protein kinase